ncbi:MAG: hypothetical protein IJK92_07130 [Bacteroidales bacterium]|nr:hypothetical protein [Bacteroidales bacterium]
MKKLYIILSIIISMLVFAHCKSHKFDVSPELLQIDNLMWLQPDSATRELSRFWANYNINSTDAFNKHYFNLLVSEALFKGGYPQSNRKRLLKAVDYFDTTDYWLSARAHYMNGVGFKAEDSVVEALYEYLHVLDIVDEHIPTPPHPRFMMLIHCRIGDLFSDQYMQEPAIVCYENALRYNDYGETNPLTRSYLLQDIGFQYDKLQKFDTARYYYNEALRNSPDTNNLNYKKAQFFMAMLDCTSGDDFENGILKAKKLVLQSPEPYRNWRYVNIGLIYKEVGQNDSALVYLHKVFDNVTKPAEQSYVAEFIHEIYESQGDTLKMTEFAKYLIEKPSNERVSMARVSTLNSMFQDYLTRHQERLQYQSRRRAIVCVSISAAVVLLVIFVFAKLRNKKKALENQKLQDEKQRLQKDFEDSKHRQFEALLKRVKSLFDEKKNKSLPFIINEFNIVYIDNLNDICKEYPNLSETEKNILILTLLNFRIKEEAELLNLSENTVMKYRSNLKKKVDFDQISSQIR